MAADMLSHLKLPMGKWMLNPKLVHKILARFVAFLHDSLGLILIKSEDTESTIDFNLFSKLQSLKSQGAGKHFCGMWIKFAAPSEIRRVSSPAEYWGGFPK